MKSAEAIQVRELPKADRIQRGALPRKRLGLRSLAGLQGG